MIIDQLAHFGFAFLVSGLGTDTGLEGLYVGFALGVVREHAQMQASGDQTIGKNRVIDVLMWSLGGCLGGML